jgi:hypothetical protein
MRIRPLSLVTAAVLCLVGLAGCTSGHDLPTISSAPSTSDTADPSYLEIVAEAYYQCMTNAGVKVELWTNQAGQNVRVWYSMQDYRVILWRDQDGQGQTTYGDDDTPSERQTKVDFVNSTGDPYELFLDGVDFSQAYKRCMTESGYDDDAAMKALQWVPDPEQEQAEIDADNKWAACARQNGWPDIYDVAMPEDPMSGRMPALTLPWSTTADQLRQLLQACPPVDKDNPDASPAIFFSTPRVTYDSNGFPDAEGQAIIDRENALMAIIQDAQTAYYASASGNPT